MTECSTGARHRAARRPSTPLTTFGQAVTGPVARRAAVAAASSGLILTIGASAGVASPSAPSAVAPVQLASLTAVPEDAVTTSPAVTVAADATWTFAAAVVSSEAPPPPPPPPPPPVEEERPAYTQTSRTNDRESTNNDDDEAEAEAEEESTESNESEAAAEEETEAAPSTSASGIGAQIVDIAFRYVGTPYVSGGESPGGFDCSGFTQYVFAQVGISLSRTSAAQRNDGYVVSASEARPGDLIWWPGHVGIYLGGNQHIAARNPGTPLSASQIWRSGATFIRVTG